ncbi:hypothetical protein ACG2LH_07955 [Zhouia sp. PK063]|uniref:hypothetical protein n=1 Tax=Zhouia sp. PK063 TaxID=3373602 RepID=UPI00379776A8
MESKNYLSDITEIKNLMNKSSRFISLSGLSGILAGIYALIGAAVAYWLVQKSGLDYLMLNGFIFNMILLDLFIVGGLSILTAMYLTTKKAKKNDEKIWDATSKRLLINLLIPFITGGIYIAIILNHEKYGQTAALMLIFYGLSLINASKYSLGDIRYLGIIEVILGLFCALLPGYGFWFWVTGFGIMHIVYGTSMYFKYDKK